METLNGMIRGELLESHLPLHADAKHGDNELGVEQGAGREGAKLNHHEIQQSVSEEDEPHISGSPDRLPSELETRQRGGEGLEGGGGQSQGLSRGEECSTMLMDCSQSKEEDAVVLGPIIGEENGVMDTAEMSFDSVVLHTLPAEGTHEGAPVEYAETLMSSPGEREGELISTVAASPSTFFQTANIDVGASTEMPASWEELRSAHAQSGYGTGPSSSDEASPGSGNSTEERAFVDSFCEEPLKADSLDTGNDQGLSGRSFEDGETRNTETLQSSGVSDTKNDDSTSPTTEDGSLGGERTPSGARPGKEKGPLGELSLRRVLSDPVTGAFLDDAMVAMCGHSFGSGNLQRVLETHFCVSCGASIPPKTLVPNFALRAAVLAYRHEDHLWQLNSTKGIKRSRDQFEMRESSEPKGTSSDPAGSAEYTCSDSRPKGVQFPFVVGDKVIIKGNKRTPERLFGIEAVITNQCLNGWYLVRTLDTGESVRLQYRSLQKLGETDSPFTSEPRLSTEQQVDSGCRPLSSDSPRGDPTCTNPVSENDLKSQPPANRQANENAISANPCTPAESLTVQSSERESNETLKQAIVGAGVEGCPTLDDGPIICSQEGGRTSNNLYVVDDLSKPVNKTGEEVRKAMETLESADQEAADAGSERRSPELLNSIDTIHVGPDDDQLLRPGFDHDTGAKVWVASSMSYPEETISRNGQGLPNTESSDGPGAIVDGEKIPQVVSSQANGNEVLRTRSRRAVVQLKSSAASGNFLHDSDPYRKVYTSGYRRRSAKEEPVITVTPDHLPTDSKPSLKGMENNGKVFERAPAKVLSVGGIGTGKQGRDLKLRSANEILQIMRKDMLKLEEQIPQNFLLRSWRVRRTKWQKQVQESHTVLELGELVRDFRYSLLLTAAGGMSDEEWDMRMSQIIETGDIGLLVPLWGRLCSDVYKWLESRPKALPSKDIRLGKPSTAENVKQDPEASGGAMSFVHMTTAATLAAVDAVTEQDLDSSIKTLLASTMKLLQQQSRSELSAVREALEWEKRHLTARLSHLEQRLTNLQGTAELNGLEDNPIHLTRMSRSPQNGECASASTDQISRGTANATPLDSRQGYETEEFESDTPLPAQEADGEATDMSDSD